MAWPEGMMEIRIQVERVEIGGSTEDKVLSLSPADELPDAPSSAMGKVAMVVEGVILVVDPSEIIKAMRILSDPT
jgi:hypothetical protein